MDTIKLEITLTYILDLKDDFTMNTTEDLYQFIDGDPVRAFCLGLNIEEWFGSLEPKQQYLYSKQLRHNKDSLSKYIDQIKYWSEKFLNENKNENDVVKLSEYILNNMFWEEEEEELDKVKLALSFGQSAKLQMNKQNGETLE